MSEKIIAEDYGHMIDLILSADGIRKAFFYKGSREWIESINDDAMRAGLEELSNKQLAIIEGFLFRNLSIMDVAIEIGEEPEKVMDEIKSIRSVLLRHI